MDYRHEFKYLVSDYQLALLRGRLMPLLHLDEHQADPNGYLIRSVYFDDIDNRYLKENIYGLDNRVKFRIRIYDHKDSVIHLETKYKVRGMTRKEMCSLTREQADMLLRGERPEFSADMPKVLRFLFLEMSTSLLKPSIIVEYQRTAFVERVGNVRITFDRNISYSTDVTGFFEDALPLTPVLRPGQHILEVKYDEFLPDYLAQTADLGDLEQCTFSKYVMCRYAR